MTITDSNMFFMGRLKECLYLSPCGFIYDGLMHTAHKDSIAKSLLRLLPQSFGISSKFGILAITSIIMKKLLYDKVY